MPAVGFVKYIVPLYFNDSHFEHWGPAQMHEIFSRRAIRIAQGLVGDWQKCSCENQEASIAAQQVIDL
jgi:hypothetical protein